MGCEDILAAPHTSKKMFVELNLTLREKFYGLG